MKTQTLVHATRRILLAAAVAATATLTANAANFYWTGAVNNYWTEPGNWELTSGNPGDRTTPTNDDAYFTDSGTYANNEIVFTNACVNSWATYVRNVGTAENPLVFRATTAANGYTFGNSGSNSAINKIGTSSGAAYLRLENGTWSTGVGTLFVGDSHYAGSLKLTDGASLSVGKYFCFKNGEVTVENGTITVPSQDFELGERGAATLNLNEGGVLGVKRIYVYSSYVGGTVLFNGGELKALGDTLVGYESSAGDKITVKVGAKGGTINANSRTVTFNRPIVADGANDGGMKFVGGGKVTLGAAPAYTGSTTIEIGTQLVVPSAIVGDKLAVGMPANGAKDGVHPMVSISGADTFAADVCNDIAKPDDAKLTLMLSPDRKTIYCLYGEDVNSQVYVGPANGNLSEASNWLNGIVPTSGNAILSCASAATLTVGDYFHPDTVTVPDVSAVVTIGAGNLQVNTLTNAWKLAIASGASLTVDGDIVAEVTTYNTSSYFLYSNEGTVTVGGLARGRSNVGRSSVCQYGVVTDNTQPIRVAGLAYDCGGDGQLYWRLNSKGNKAGMWVVGSRGFSWPNRRNADYSKFYTETSTGHVKLHSSADWTLSNSGKYNTGSGDLWVNGASVTIDTSDYDDPTVGHVVTLNGRVKTTSNANADAVIVTGCGTVVVNTSGTSGSLSGNDRETLFAAGTSLVVTNGATLKVNAGKKILGAGTISLAAGTTLALQSTADTFTEAEIVPVTPPETGVATLKIDGTRLLCGVDNTICRLSDLPEGYVLKDHLNVTGTALGGRRCKLKAVEVTENETTVTKLVANISPIGLVLIFK